MQDKLKQIISLIRDNDDSIPEEIVRLANDDEITTWLNGLSVFDKLWCVEDFDEDENGKVAPMHVRIRALEIFEDRDLTNHDWNNLDECLKTDIGQLTNEYC